MDDLVDIINRVVNGDKHGDASPAPERASVVSTSTSSASHAQVRPRHINLWSCLRALPAIPDGADGPACRWPLGRGHDLRGMGVPVEALPEDLAPWSAAGWILRLGEEGAVQMVALPGCRPVRGDELRRDLQDIHVQRRTEITLDAWLDLQARLDALDASSAGQPLDTPEACEAVVQLDGLSLARVPESMKTDVVCLAAVQNKGLALQFVPVELRSHAICLAAVAQNARAMEDVPEELKTPEFCLDAVRRNSKALDFVPDAVRTEAFCLDAVRESPQAFACWRCHKTPGICMEAVRRDGRLLRWMPAPLRTREMCIAAYKSNPAALVDVPEHVKRK